GPDENPGFRGNVGDAAVGGEAPRRIGLERSDDEVGERLLERDVVAADRRIEQRRLHLDPEPRRGAAVRLGAAGDGLARDLAVALGAQLAELLELADLAAEQAQPPHRLALAPRGPVA